MSKKVMVGYALLKETRFLPFHRQTDKKQEIVCVLSNLGDYR
jgi:hypothetical protein